MPEIRGNLARSVRRLARFGHSVESIAERHALDAAAVRAFLATTPNHLRFARGKARRILAQTGPCIRDLVARGWRTPDIAAALDLDPDRVRDFIRRCQPVRRDAITRPRTREEQEALDRRARARKRAKPNRPKFVDQWRLAEAAGEPGYADPAPRVTRLAATPDCGVAPPAAELVEELPRVEALPTPGPSTWEGPISAHATSGPRKITPDVLADALRLYQAGESWPQIARRFGVCRNALYHARRRLLGICRVGQ